MKNLLIAAAAFTMFSGVASATPDKWEQRGEYLAQVQMSDKADTLYDAGNVDFGTTASIGSVDSGEISKPHKARNFNR